MAYDAQKKDSTTALILSILGGFFCITAGIDRIYLGQVGLGILKCATFGGFGIWWLIDIFLMKGEVEKHNTQIVQSLQAVNWAGGY